MRALRVTCSKEDSLILAEYKVALETTESVGPTRAKRLLSGLEYSPDSEMQSALESLIGNFLPISVRVERIDPKTRR